MNDQTRAAIVFGAISWLVLGTGADALGEPRESPQKRAVDEVRTAGVALFEWYGVSKGTLPTKGPGATATALDVTSTTVVDAEGARAMGLPPAAVSLLIGQDPWGNPYEVRLGDGESAPTLIVRCAGTDGRFEGDRYPIGPFHVDEAEHDIVWVDGYFVRWPKRE